AFAPHPVEEARRFGGRAADLERERDLVVVGQPALGRAEAAVGAKLAQKIAASEITAAAEAIGFSEGHGMVSSGHRVRNLKYRRISQFESEKLRVGRRRMLGGLVSPLLPQARRRRLPSRHAAPAAAEPGSRATAPAHGNGLDISRSSARSSAVPDFQPGSGDRSRPGSYILSTHHQIERGDSDERAAVTAELRPSAPPRS